MKLWQIKTLRGRAPMQKTENPIPCEPEECENSAICIFPDMEYQTVEGFGGAFTEASAVTLEALSEENRERIIKLYFDPDEGIGYNIGRIHMNSCDFSLGNYACVEENDQTLSTFNIDRDKKWVIPMIRRALKYNDIRFMMSPWSPPAYMKTNGEMNNGGKLKAEYAPLWALHFEKFIEEYKKEGINISRVSVQNEPRAVQTWDSCVYTAEEERDFVKNHLGARMKALGVEVMFWDHNKERVLERAKVMLSDEAVEKFISGIAVHWYSGDHFEQLRMFAEKYPGKKIMFSEGCYEYSLGESDTVKIGERYANDIIGNFNNFCSSFCDWNLLLNEKGGPNHVGNFCDAPIMADTRTDTVYIHDSYYYIGHFSRFVKPGAVRIGSSVWNSSIKTVSFKNPDGSIITVVLNATDESHDFKFRIEGKVFSGSAEAHSIATYIFEKGD